MKTLIALAVALTLAACSSDNSDAPLPGGPDTTPPPNGELTDQALDGKPGQP